MNQRNENNNIRTTWNRQDNNSIESGRLDIFHLRKKLQRKQRRGPRISLAWM
jgi:hypothetical protein